MKLAILTVYFQLYPSNTVVFFIVEMSSHDINTSVQLRLYSKLLSLDLFKPDNGPFDHRMSAIISK